VPLVRRAVDSALAADLDETIVVMGAVDLLEVLPEEVTVLHNEAWEQGQATSLAAAVSYAGSRGHRAVVFGCGDQPGVPPRRGRRWETPTATSRWRLRRRPPAPGRIGAPCGAICPSPATRAGGC